MPGRANSLCTDAILTMVPFHTVIMCPRCGLTDIRASNIGPQQFFPLLRRKILQRSTKLHAGIVDENVDRSDRLFDSRNAVANGINDRHVKAGNGNSVPGSGQVLCRGVKLAAIPSVQHDGGAMLGEPAGDGEPDALRRSSDERPLARQIEQLKCHRYSLPIFGQTFFYLRSSSISSTCCHLRSPAQAPPRSAKCFAHTYPNVMAGPNVAPAPG